MAALQAIHFDISRETGENDPAWAERRASPREPTHDLSEIVTESRFATTCMVRNISATGALIEAGTRETPERFVLVNHARKLRAVCRVVWRDGRMLGVRFVSPPRTFS